MHINGKAFRTIWFDEKDQAVKIIDQTKLPHKFEVKNLKTVKDAINAIKTMEVRGAPLIGAAAAYGIVLAIMESNDPEFIKTLMKNAENAKNMIKLVIENFESKIMKNDPANKCLDTAIITNPKAMTTKTKNKLKNIAGRVLFKK